MKNLFAIIGLALLVASCSQPAADQKSGSADSTAQKIERGKYIVTIAGCNDCHSPKMMTDKGPVPDPARLLSGHPENMPLEPYDTSTAKGWMLFNMNLTAMHGPWGTSFTANLTPDTATGLGSWTEQQFFTAIRKGWYKGIEGGRMLLPPMPWQGFAEMTDEDLRSVFAYLKSLPPVRNAVPAAIPPGQ